MILPALPKKENGTLVKFLKAMNSNSETSKYFLNRYGDLCCTALVQGQRITVIISGFVDIDGQECFKSDENGNSLKQKIYWAFDL